MFDTVLSVAPLFSTVDGRFDARENTNLCAFSPFSASFGPFGMKICVLGDLDALFPFLLLPRASGAKKQ